MPHFYTNEGEKRKLIRKIAEAEPDLTPREIALRVHTTRDYVYKSLRRVDSRSAPINRRLVAVEQRLKNMEEVMLKVLAAKGLLHERENVGL